MTELFLEYQKFEAVKKQVTTQQFTHCVKCGAAKGGGAECPHCGVIYQKAETAIQKIEANKEQKAQSDWKQRDNLSFYERLQGAGVVFVKTIKDNLPICPRCGYQGFSRSTAKGSIFIEIFLWIFFLIPGILYSLWRLTNRDKECPMCGAPNMIPANSPLAFEIKNRIKQGRGGDSQVFGETEEIGYSPRKKSKFFPLFLGVSVLLILIIAFWADQPYQPKNPPYRAEWRDRETKHDQNNSADQPAKVSTPQQTIPISSSAITPSFSTAFAAVLNSMYGNVCKAEINGIFSKTLKVDWTANTKLIHSIKVLAEVGTAKEDLYRDGIRYFQFPNDAGTYNVIDWKTGEKTSTSDHAQYFFRK